MSNFAPFALFGITFAVSFAVGWFAKTENLAVKVLLAIAWVAMVGIGCGPMLLDRPGRMPDDGVRLFLWIPYVVIAAGISMFAVVLARWVRFRKG
jgi:hypothetical protein